MTISSYTATFFTLGSNSRLAERLFRFRHELFVTELGWSLPGLRGLEQDAFDGPDANYCCLLKGEKIIGCFRAIPCSRPYLARSVFPYMAKLKPYPISHRYQEISRLGILSSYRRASFQLYSLMLRYGIGQQVRALVALADLAHERHLNRIGLQTVRYGSTQIAGFREDGSWLLAVAGEIPISDPPTIGMEALIKLTENMEIEDETHVLGRERISA